MDIQIHENFEEIFHTIFKYKLESNHEALEKLAVDFIEQGQTKEYTYIEGIGYYALAEAKYLQEDYLECNRLYWKIHFICENNDYPRLYALSSNVAGKTNGNQGDFHNAITLFLQGYYIAKENKYTDIEAWILNNIGTLFFNLEHYDEAIRYFERAKVLVKKDEFWVQEFHEILIMNIISVYLRTKDFQKVEQWTKEFYELFPKEKNALISNGMQMKKVLHAYDLKRIEEFKSEVITLVEVTKQCWTGNYALQILIETSELCYELKVYEEMELCLQFLKERIQNADFRKRIQLSSLMIKLYRAKKETDLLYQELDTYYALTKQSQLQEKNIEFKGLKNKIILEREISAKKRIIEKNEELTAMSERDPFTGLLNKASFIEHTRKKLRTLQEGESQVIIIIDVDDFKYVNDTYGHLVGDEVLKLLSNSLLNTFRLEDYVGRIGGDEFCIYVKGMLDEQILREKIEAIRKEIENLYIPSNTECKVTASIGVLLSNKKRSYEELFVLADNALYEAKKQGKNCFHIVVDV